MSIASVPGGLGLYIDKKAARMGALRKTVYNAGMGLNDEFGSTHTPWFITLTYRCVEDWRPNDIRDYLKRIRSWLYRKGHKLRYIWVAELQKRGAVHYHLMVWFPKGLWIPMSDRRGWWPHGFTESKPARKGVGYLMKYCSKGSKDDLVSYPRGCRVFAVGGLTDSTRRRVRWWRAPNWFRKLLPDSASFITHDLRKIKAGYCDRVSGFEAKSPYSYLTWVPSGVILYRVDDVDIFSLSDVWSVVPTLL